MSTNDANQSLPTPLEALENTSLPTRTTDSPAPEAKRESLPLPENQLQHLQTQQQQPLQRQQSQQPQTQLQQEYTRRYIQWKEEDIALLLDDLEKPGHYENWKTNKSGYGKRVAEEVFRDIVYQDGIKFKVRWLENRIRKYDQILTIETNQGGEPARLKLLEKIHKEFPFYYRAKRIFESTSPSSSSSSCAEKQQQVDAESSTAAAPPLFPHPASSSPSVTAQSHDLSQTATSSGACATEGDEAMKTASPTRSGYNSAAWQIIQPNATPPPATTTTTTTTTTAPTAVASTSTLGFAPNPTNANHNTFASVGPSKRRKLVNRVSDELTRDRQLRLMELELESKKMDHDERMQQMKLEQLRLEIELEKIRSGRRSG